VGELAQWYAAAVAVCFFGECLNSDNGLCHNIGVALLLPLAAPLFMIAAMVFVARDAAAWAWKAVVR
jgi:hypothetical protein